METVRDFILGGSKITADGDCSPEIKRHLLLGRKVLTNLFRILKSRDITLPTKVQLFGPFIWSSKSYGFFSSHVWMWELDYKENWVPNNWCFWTVVLEMTLESPLDCKEIQPVNPKGSPEYPLEGPTLRLKLQYFGYLMRITDLLEKTLMLERLKAGGEGMWGYIAEDEMVGCHLQLNGPELSSGSWWCTGKPGVLQSMGSQRFGHDWVTELTNWLTYKIITWLQSNNYLVCFCLLRTTVPSIKCPTPESFVHSITFFIFPFFR